MVSPRRYLAHHEAEANKISKRLSEFGHSGEVEGFWCNRKPYAHMFDCMKCPEENYCPKDHPPLERRYNPDDETNWRRLSGDHMLLMLHEGRGVKDYLWLQHPETRR